MTIDSELQKMEQEILKLYEVKPWVRAGERYAVTDFGYREVVAEEDKYPIFYEYVYLRLLAYLSQNQEWERFELPEVDVKHLKLCILQWYKRNKHMVNSQIVEKLISHPKDRGYDV